MLSLYVRFRLVPSAKRSFIPHLTELMRDMAKEPTFVSAVLSEDEKSEDELVLFEMWNGSKDEWLREQSEKPYRADYDDATKDFIADKDVRFLSPIAVQN